MSVYLDNAASTRVLKEASLAALDAMTRVYGNPSSLHAAGRSSRALLDDARQSLCSILSIDKSELYFTSGGTESINTALFSASFKNKHLGKHIVSSQIEHDATLNALTRLKNEGFEITLVPPERDGSVDIEKIKASLRPDTILMSLMGVCNETGALLPYNEAALALHKINPRALFHLDAVQLFCKLPLSLDGIDLCSFSAHKIGGVKGCGALFIKKGLSLRPLIYGGGQENGMRSGTEALPSICAFAEAALNRSSSLACAVKHYDRLKETLLNGLSFPFALNSPQKSSSHIVNISPLKLRSEVLIRMLSDRGFYVSGGSACSRGKASHVLKAMRLPRENTDAALRISFCPENTEEEVAAFCRALSEIITEE